MLEPVLEFPFFSGLSNIPLYRQTTFCLSVHLLMATWAISGPVRC